MVKNRVKLDLTVGQDKLYSQIKEGLNGYHLILF